MLTLVKERTLQDPSYWMSGMGPWREKSEWDRTRKLFKQVILMFSNLHRALGLLMGKWAQKGKASSRRHR